MVISSALTLLVNTINLNCSRTFFYNHAVYAKGRLLFLLIYGLNIVNLFYHVSTLSRQY